jgi:hypothetical protein
LASERELKVRIVGEDRASPALRGVNKELTNLGPAGEKVGGSLRRIQDRLEHFGTVGKIASNAVGKWGAAAVAGFAAAGAAVARFANSAINAASDLQEQQAATEQIFGDSAEAVEDFAKTSARSLGISARAAHEAANAFGDLFLNVGFSDEQTALFSEGLVRLAGDLASFKNLDTGDVLQKLRSGLSGEAEPLKALGILINETAVKTKALELGLGGSNRQLTEGEKVAARYALIIEKTATAQDDAARTADSYANKQRQLNARWEDAQAKLGEKLVPVAQAFARRGRRTAASGATSVRPSSAGFPYWGTPARRRRS